MCETRTEKVEERKRRRWRNRQFFEAPKIMKTFVYVYNTMLLVLNISKEDFTVFSTPYKPSRHAL